MTSPPPAIHLDRLTKRYRGRLAVDGLSADVPPGVVAGFIGPNGAGKTTTMAMLLGLVRPTSGTGTVLGEPIEHPARYLHRVGALIEGPALWPALTGRENLRLLARLGGHPARRIDEVLDLVDLSDRQGDRFGEYSLGMKQRLGVAAALLPDPELLVLDEPTNGLDPAGIAQMRQLVRRVSAQGRTVLVSSHLLGELEHVVDWLLVIDGGRVVLTGDATALGAGRGSEVVLAPACTEHLGPLAELVRRHATVVSCGPDLVVAPPAGEDPHQVAASMNATAAGAGIVLRELHVRRPNLEARYLDLLEGTR